MAYQTGGSGGVLTDLMDAVRAFALSLGWTIDKWDSVNRLLFMTKGLCTVTMKGDTTQTVRIYTGAHGAGTYVDTPDHRIYFAMGTSNNAALTNYYGHPGSPVTSAYDGDAPVVNGLTGPYVGWFLFADPTVSDHIHCVVQIAVDKFMHFSLGHVDKRQMTHGGVAYVTAQGNNYWRNRSDYLNSYTGNYNNPAYQNIPFVAAANNGMLKDAQYDNCAPMILKNSNAWPADWMGPLAYASGSGSKFGVGHREFLTQTITSPANWPYNNSGVGALLDCVVQAEAAPYSNVVPLFPIPCFRYHYDSSIGANSRRLCYVGDYPNVRFCNMTGMVPGQEIDVGGNTFKVFPVLRQSLWSDTLLFDAPMSGQFAIAYKKVA
jgi:hypothetical protein